MPEHSSIGMFSVRRLGGEPVPNDVQILLRSAQDLFARSGIELNGDSGWKPWLDTSYLTEADWRDPALRAEVWASAKVCEGVAFIAAHEDAEYYGYWRGFALRPIVTAPLVLLDNEGQFQLCGATFAEALLSRTDGEEQFAEMRDWLQSLGIVGLPTTPLDRAFPQIDPSPQELHERFVYLYTENASDT